jgi:hypothetical protein
MTGGAGNGKRYFSHDSDAFFDSRIVKMRTRLGVAGYGAYWMIVERLRTSEGYKHECDYEVFACLANADAELFRAVVEDHGLFEFVENDGKRYFYSESLIRRMMKMEDIIEKRREAGRKGAEARWQTDDNADPLPEQENDTNVASAIANAKQVLSDCHSTALAKNGKLNKTKLNKTKDKHIMVESDATKTSKVTQSDQFDQFWAIYPKKVGKKAALNIWTRLKPDKDLLEQILRAVEKQKKLDQWTKDGGQFIPNPATWLNQCRWEDELPTGSGKGYNQRGQSQPERERIKDDSEYEHETNAQNSPYFQAWYAEEQAKRARETREVTA